MNNNIDDLKHIRSMMERSTKFLSLSGFSGVAAGIFALLGALIAYFILYKGFTITGYLVYDLLLDAAFVLTFASLSGFYFSYRKAKKTGAKFMLASTRHIAIDFAIPMITGGIFCLLLIYHHYTHMVSATMLIFYGLALVSAGSRTYYDIKRLGVCEIALGFLAGFFPYNGLLFWTIGFGLLHIFYGVIMHCKYDKMSNKNEEL